VVFRHEDLKRLRITTLSSGHRLPPLASLQIRISQYGALAFLDNKNRQIVVDRAVNLLGPVDEAWPRVDAAVRRAVDSEEDIGKLAYYLASLRVYEKEGGAERLVEYSTHSRPLVRFLAVYSLAVTRPKIDAAKLLPALIDRDRDVACAAAMALLQNADPQKASRLLRILADKESVLSDEFRERVRTALANAIRWGVSPPRETSDLETALDTLFPEDKTISGYVERSRRRRNY
jgi:HEAT repeat protein